MKNKLKIFIVALVALATNLFISSCNKKDEFLDAVPNNHLTIPRTLTDLQAVLQNETLFNYYNDPPDGVLSADEYYASPSLYNKADAFTKGEYTWDKSLQSSSVVQSSVIAWQFPYEQIYPANVVLDELQHIKINTTQQAQYNQIKGTALFFRAKAYFNLMQLFSLPYNPASAGSNLGVPLRLTADINLKVGRSTEKDCYAQIINDLETAIQLLPAQTAKITQPNITAANGFLARVYLSIGDYDNAFKYANYFLSKFNVITDYNSYNALGYIDSFPSEVEFLSSMGGGTGFIRSFSAFVDTTIVSSYAANDLRKPLLLYLNGNGYVFLGTYDVQTYSPFNGIATDEIYLIRAECYARQGNTSAAMQDLNTLLKMRFLTNTFVPYTATSADDALSQILTERKKELLFRGLRWSDLRRLNQDPRFAKTLTRNINGTIYTLPPNDPRYALPIPQDEIQLNPMPQNAR